MEKQCCLPSEGRRSLKRRLWSVIVPLCLIGVLWALLNPLIPPLYRSTATMRIEALPLPSELATSGSKMRQHVEHRLRRIGQQVLTPNQLTAVIEHQALYPDLRHRAGLEAVQMQLRQRIALRVTEITRRNTLVGEPPQATVTYTLSFCDTSAHVAQSVTQELAALFLREHLATPQVNHAALPLHTETEALSAEIAALQAQVSTAEQQPGDVQTLAAVTQAYQQAVAKYRALRERSLYAEQAQALAHERQGERLLLLQAPAAPTQPDAVQRGAWFGVGVLLAVAVSVAPLTWLERLGAGVRGVQALQSAAPFALLSVIPYIETATARRARLRRTLLRTALAMMLILAALILFQQFVMPFAAFGTLLWQHLHDLLPLELN